MKYTFSYPNVTTVYKKPKKYNEILCQQILVINHDDDFNFARI